ncbi:MAG: YIP1 family protein [Betaproteobacteria bacterium]|nr:YIP1 family protein [Betaproteobacteria bacterium]
MALVDRVKNILLSPKTEWPLIEQENATTAGLLKDYAAPLIVAGAVCSFIGLTLIGVGGFGFSFKLGFVDGLVQSILRIVLGLVSVVIVGYIIDALAPTFGAQKNLAQAMKTSVYAHTAAWVAALLGIIPALGIIGVLISLYSIYLLYLGLPVTMKCPADKAVPYTAVVVIAAIVVFIIIGVALAAVTPSRMPGGSFNIGSRGGGQVTIEPGSAAAKLDDFAKKMEAAGKKMDAAQKSGKPEEAVAAAMTGLGAAFGGKAAEPVGIELLKPLVPETFAGLPKKSARAEKAGALGFMISEAEARYGEDGGKNVTLKISDTGGAAGLMTLASWVQGEREDEYGREKTYKAGNRTVHEKVRKDGRNEYAVILAERFVVSARGAVDYEVLKGAVNAIDLAKLESMKDMGVTK